MFKCHESYSNLVYKTKLPFTEFPTLGNLDFNVKDVNYKAIVGGNSFKVNINFGLFKFEKVEVYILKIKEDSPYVVPSSGVEISSDNVMNGIAEANTHDLNII